MGEHGSPERAKSYNFRVTDRAAACAARWGFIYTEQLESGHCSDVYADDTRVLKVPFQGEEMTSGYFAARILSGGLGARVLEGDQESGIVLMERIRPGTTLSNADLPDEEAQSLVTNFIRHLQALPTEGCMPLAHYIEEPDDSLDYLAATTTEPVFLHGDLHHANILRNGDGWTVIDPKGLVGDRHYEPIAFLRNPCGWLDTVPNLLGLTRQRILRFAKELDLDPWRIAAWGVLDSKPGPNTDPDSVWGRLPAVYKQLEVELRP